MRQQINLYQPIFSEERKLFSAVTATVALTLVAVALMALGVYADWRVGRLAQNVEAMREQQVAQEALLTKGSELNAARSNPVVIEARIRQLTVSVTERTSALHVLQAGAAGQTTGFATRLEALARRRVEGLWIDSVVLSGTNGSMSLSGGTLDPDIVPAYLQGLARETVLSGTRFDDFVIQRPSKDLETASDASPDVDSDVKHKKSAPTKHIRFRAGSKSLSAAQLEAAI